MRIVGNNQINSTVASIVQELRNRTDSELIKAMGIATNSTATHSEPLTIEKFVIDLAKEVFGCDVHITNFEPKPDKDGRIPLAYVIDHTKVPNYQTMTAFGKRSGPEKTIVFPSVENALVAIAEATRGK